MRRLARQRKARSEERAFVIDGPTLVDEALTSPVVLDEVLAGPGADPALLERCAAEGVVVRSVPAGVLERVAATVTPQPVAAVAKLPDVSLTAALERLAVATGERQPASPRTALVLVSVADPGNLGTLCRSAAAAGFGTLICCDDGADPYGPKAVRASAGSLFRVQVVRECSAAAALDGLRAAGLRCYGAVPRGGVPYDQARFSGDLAIVLGSEAHGLPEGVQGRLSDDLLSVPMDTAAESLNVAMAGTVLCFEVSRQRRLATAEGTGQESRSGGVS